MTVLRRSASILAVQYSQDDMMICTTSTVQYSTVQYVPVNRQSRMLKDRFALEGEGTRRATEYATGKKTGKVGRQKTKIIIVVGTTQQVKDVIYATRN